MIYIVWMTSLYEQDTFFAAFDNLAAAEEYKNKLVTEVTGLDQHRLSRGYIDYVVEEVELYHEARDARPR